MITIIPSPYSIDNNCIKFNTNNAMRTNAPTSRNGATVSTTTTTVKSQGRGRSNSLPTPVVEYLKTWLMQHMHHPYPTDQEKAEMVLHTGIDVKRLNNWFVNNRIRYWKPRMEAYASQKQRPQRQDHLVAFSAQQQQQQQQRPQLVTASILEGPYTRLLSSSKKHLSTSVSEAAPAQAQAQLQPHELVHTASTMDIPIFKSAHPPPSSSSTIPNSTSYLSVVSDESVDGEGDDLSDGTSSIRSNEQLSQEYQQQNQHIIVVSSCSTNVTLHREHDHFVTPSPKKNRSSSLSRKRSLPEQQVKEQHVLSTPRTKFSRKNEILWREACCLSSPRDDIKDEATLPTLDEAALLFGFAKTNHY